MPPPISAPASNPSTQITLQVDNDSELPKLLEGRTVAVLGQPLENLTAEAHEYRRKINLHDQLVRARRLRAILEDAANRADALPHDSPSSYSAAMEILLSTIPQINELVKLTEALRGGYTLDHASDYDEWNEWTRLMDKAEGEQFMRDQRILRQQLRELGKESNKDLQLDTEIERKHDELISRATEWPVKIFNEIDQSSDEERDKMHLSERNKKKNASRCIDEVVVPSNRKRHALKESESSKMYITERQGNRMSSNETDQNVIASSPPESGHIGLIKRIESERAKAIASAVGSNTSSLKQTASPTKKTKELPASSDLQKCEKKRPPDSGKESAKKKHKKKEQSSRKNPPETSFSPSSSTTQTTKPHAKPADGSSRPIKKCHHCKESTTRYRKCSYWQVTGNKCGKTFCIECLSSKYSLGDDVQGKDNPNGIPIEEIVRKATHDNEWHCPSCLKTCLCNACLKQRERDEQRERSRDQGGRRSGRRTAEQSDYSNFFHMSGGMVSFS